MIIFGWGRTTVRDLGDVVAATCVNCHNAVLLRHVVVRVWFTLFFIPLIPYRRDRLLVCPVCAHTHDLGESAKDAAEDMRSITAAWRGGQMTDADYYARVEAFWALTRPATPAAPPSLPGDPA